MNHSAYIRLSKVCLIFSLVFLIGTSLNANITNEGNEAIDVEITRLDGGKSRSTVYPEQSIATPENTKTIKAISRTSRGDEVVKLKINQGTAEPFYLEKTGAVFELGKEQVQVVKKVLATAKNEGNVAIKLLLTQESGIGYSIDILPTETAKIPANITEIKLMSRISLPRGDEIISLVVTMPTGETKNLYSVGSKINFKETEASKELSKFDFESKPAQGNKT